MRLVRLMAKAAKKTWGAFLRKVDSKRYVKSFLGINCSSPESVYLFGRVDFGTEPWIITLGHRVFITDGVKFITHDGGTLLFRDRVPDLEITKPIVLGDNVYIGNNALLLPGISIGNNVVIGAGAVVAKNIPANSVVVGNPCKVIKSADDYFEKICSESLHLGNLTGLEKDKALRRYFNSKVS